MEEDDEETRKDERSQAQLSPDLPALVADVVQGDNRTVHWSEEMKSNFNSTAELDGGKAVNSYPQILTEPEAATPHEDLLRQVKSEEHELKVKNASTSVSHINLAQSDIG